MKKVIIVGAGMAGSEAAWQVAQRGIKVDLYEMRPKKSTPAHKTEKFAELEIGRASCRERVSDDV